MPTTLSGVAPKPSNEAQRVAKLLQYDLDFSQTQALFGDLTNLAARIAGTEISLLNLIDDYTQWSVARTGIDLTQMPREDSVCQFSIHEPRSLEIHDLKADERFMDKPYVAGAPYLRYYFGVPLATASGEVLGSLCVLDGNPHNLSPEKKEMFRMVGEAVMNRLEMVHALRTMNQRIKIITHDIRSPLSGIIKLSEIVKEDAVEGNYDDLEASLQSIMDAGSSVLGMADDILEEATREIEASRVSTKQALEGELSLKTLKEKLEALYQVQAKIKDIYFEVVVSQDAEIAELAFPKDHIIQILGNLISNAIKFTPSHGQVEVVLDLECSETGVQLRSQVKDTGPGMTREKLLHLDQNNGSTSQGSEGELGFGFGLSIVRQKVEEMGGEWNISSQPDEGTVASLILPVA